MFTISAIRTNLTLSALAALALTGVNGAASAEPMAQSAPPLERPAGPSAAGRWLHDEQGNVIGSVRSFADGGQTAILMIGSYFEQGSHLAVAPASSLYVAAGQVRLRTSTAGGMNLFARR